MTDRFYCLGPYEWRSGDGAGGFAWTPPEGTIAAIDLRSLPAMGRRGRTPRGVGLFVTDRTLNSDYTFLGRALDDHLTPETKSAWRSLVHRGALTSARIVDALWETLTIRADPTGATAPRPLTPTHRGSLAIMLPRHGRISAKRFSPDLVEWANIREALRHDYRRLRAESTARGSELHRRTLSWWAAKYHVPYREFQAADVRDETPLPHETTITDDFNRVDADPPSDSGEGWGWTQVQGSNWMIASNRLHIEDGSYANHRLRAESDLSGTDQQVDADIEWPLASTRSAGLMARYSSSADTGYWADARADAAKDRIGKVVNGSTSGLLNNDMHTPGPGSPIACTFTADGSNLRWVVAGVCDISTTDTSITAGTRSGLRGLAFNTDCPFWDNFLAKDLAPVAMNRSLLTLGVG